MFSIFFRLLYESFYKPNVRPIASEIIMRFSLLLKIHSLKTMMLNIIFRSQIHLKCTFNQYLSVYGLKFMYLKVRFDISGCHMRAFWVLRFHVP